MWAAGRGIGNLGARAAITTAATGTGVATGMMMPSATNAASGASAIKAAFDAAHPSCGRMGLTSRAAKWRWSRAALLRKVGVSPNPPEAKAPQPFALISPSPQFKGNAFAGSAETKLDAEAAAFRDGK